MTARILIVGLFEAVLRSGTTVRLTDGGVVTAFGETFESDDAVYGSIASCESLNEGVGDEVTALRIGLLPKDSASIPTLAQPGNQRSQVRMWTAEVDPESGTIIGTPNLEFRGQVERMPVKFGRSARTVELEVAATGVKLLNRWKGNARSAAFHKRVWPGETGEDNRTGLGIQVAWGAPSPPRGTASVASSGAGGSRAGIFDNRVNYV